MSRACAEEIRTLIRSGWRLIALESFEEDRALSLLERVAEGAERRLLRWSVASGLGDRGHGAWTRACARWRPATSPPSA
jgi:hypothetical protein